MPKETLVIHSKIEEVQKVYEWIEKHVHDAQFEKKLQNQILLITQEIVTNGIIHGNNLVASKKVVITFQSNSKEIRITVEDEGEGSPSLPTKEEAQELDYLAEDGRGLKLAVLICKEIIINKNLTTLVFEKEYKEKE
ncbi:MAG: Unknown protein [uncultured Sulfurovum sp.]|uniref:Histidine kinase/HSP90-like ATPase domain-containing protein n=1 Tax=uncultured Sulfurovum sp. TaxID=269237 RepID=A0A6S6U561_9BACT|nr:MAG: Unknown protein [uncultured Sulfurovum sp.]